MHRHLLQGRRPAGRPCRGPPPLVQPALPCAEYQAPAGSLPSGQLISSAEDMAHYLIAQLNAGRYGEVHPLGCRYRRDAPRGEGIGDVWHLERAVRHGLV